MIAHGEDPNTADNTQKSTPLHLAVKETNVNAVRVLVQSENCDVNLQVRAITLLTYDVMFIFTKCIMHGIDRSFKMADDLFLKSIKDEVLCESSSSVVEDNFK